MSQSHITIVGAGIVGVCCARFLQRAGYQVTVVDRGEPGKRHLVWQHGHALCHRGTLYPCRLWRCSDVVPQMLMDQSSPLAIRWRYLPRLMPWLVRFVGNAPEATRMKNARSMALLMKDTLSAYATLLEGSDAAQYVRRRGSLEVYRTEAAFAAEAGDRERIRSLGAPVEELNSDEIKQLEPNISRDYRYGVYFPDCGHTFGSVSTYPGSRARCARGRGTVCANRGCWSRGW